MNHLNEVVFVYLGKRLPAYALASLELAQRYSGCQVRLIGNTSQLSAASLGNFSFTPIESFYDNSSFDSVKSKIIFDHRFRDAFWLKTLERFFVLEQYMEFSNSPTLLHAELDQVLFDLNLLAENLAREQGEFIALPFHSPTMGMASILYVKSKLALEKLTVFAQSSIEFSNEMELLASFASINPNYVRVLPTLASETRQELKNDLVSRGITRVRPKSVGGFVDAAQVGQWIGGADPRNTPLTKFPETKYVAPTSAHTLSREELARYSYNLNEAELSVSGPGLQPTRLYNLHLHSKTHRALLRDDSLLSVLLSEAKAGKPVRIAGTRRDQVLGRVKDFFDSLWRFLTRFIRVPEHKLQ